MLYICNLVKFRVKTEIWYDLKAWLYAPGKPEIAQIQSVYKKVPWKDVSFTNCRYITKEVWRFQVICKKKKKKKRSLDMVSY